MKIHCWGVIFGVAGLMLAAALLDWPGLQSGEGVNINNNSALTYEWQAVLRACSPVEKNSPGPLVPEKSIPNSEKLPGETTAEPEVPRSAWSTRAGFSISSSTDPDYWAQMLGSGWYLDWNVRTEAQADDPDHWQMIRVHEDCISPSVEVIQSAAGRLPGKVWIIGNEPDVIWQDNVTPARYATVYHILYRLIKSSDPAASIAVAGISQPTSLRLQYLDQVLQTYQQLYNEPMSADWWTVHGYVLREEKGSWGVEIPPGIIASQGELYEVSDHGRIDLFESQLVAFRQWMADHGYQNTPLALTEFGILMPAAYGFPTELVGDYLEQTFAWLFQARDISTGFPADEYHLVQKWAWFSIADPNYTTSDLGDLSSGKLTVLGDRFRNTVNALTP